MSEVQIIIPGQAVPTIDVPIQGGGRLTNAEFAKNRFTLIAFYRGVHCPKCRRQLLDLHAQVSRLRNRDTAIFAVSGDTAEAARRAKVDLTLPDLPIGYGFALADARRWGLFVSEARPDGDTPPVFNEPGQFLIRGDGTLFASWTQSSSWGRPPLEDMLVLIERADEAEYGTLAEAPAQTGAA
jgi:peroxiredoxin